MATRPHFKFSRSETTKGEDVDAFCVLSDSEETCHVDTAHPRKEPQPSASDIAIQSKIKNCERMLKEQKGIQLAANAMLRYAREQKKNVDAFRNGEVLSEQDMLEKMEAHDRKVDATLQRAEKLLKEDTTIANLRQLGDEMRSYRLKGNA